MEWIWSKFYDEFKENYKGFTRNPKWLLMRKLARFNTIRSIVASFSKPTSEVCGVVSGRSLFEDIDVNQVVESLRKDGLCLGINLPQDTTKEIRDFAISTPCNGNRNRKLNFFCTENEQAQAKYGKRLVLGSYSNTALLCPAIKKLADDPKLLEIAARYLEAEPVHQGNGLWWSFTGEATFYEQLRHAQLFHYDLDDYRCLKFYFYLTDVDLSSGPHVCVRGSHEQKKLSHQFIRRRHSDQDIADYYGIDSIVTICGKAGFGFAEDPFCFHKGTTPMHRDRLMLQIEFAINDYGMQNDCVDPLLLKDD